MGYLVSKNGIGMDPAKVSAVLEWPIPTTVKEVQSFLGFSNFYRKFTAAELNHPIYDKELLAVVAAFKQWRVYLEGAQHPI